MPSVRRFPPPWTAEETDACFIVRDANGQALAQCAPRRAKRCRCRGERGPVAFIIARLEPVMHFCFGHNSRGVSVRRPGYDDAKE